LPKRILLPGYGFAATQLTDLFAWPAGFRALLCAIQAFAAIAFQTCRDSVISLDLTGIIAFDAFREWEAVHRQPMRVREWP
jgi:general L-amino acid transport system substrate-binding protein